MSMIHPALYKLIGLQGRALMRRMLRGGATPGRILVLIVGLAIFIIWLALALSTMGAASDPRLIQVMVPMALLGICVVTAVTSLGDKAIAFTAGEVDQLFPGPFTRRELLGYKLLKSAMGAILTGLVLSVALLKHARWWPACFAGAYMSLLFVQLFSIALLLASQAIGNAAYSRARRLILLGAGIVLILAAGPWLSAGLRDGKAAAFRFHASPVGQVVLAPFEPFGQLMTASTYGAVVKWSLLTAFLNGALVVIVLMLDAYYVETAMSASERRYAKIQRARSTGILSVGVSKTASWHLPQAPWLGGAGPILWRQLTTAGRAPKAS